MTAQFPFLRLVHATWIVLLFLLGTSSPIRARDRTFVPVAGYLNQSEVVEKEGKRAAAILTEHKVTHFLGDQILDKAAWAKWTATHGADFAVIFVPRDESAQARVVLARAIKAEELRLKLMTDDGTTIGVDRILQSGKKP